MPETQRLQISVCREASAPHKEDKVPHDLSTRRIGDEVAGNDGCHEKQAHDHCEDLAGPEDDKQEQERYEGCSNLAGLQGQLGYWKGCGWNTSRQNAIPSWYDHLMMF